MCVSEDKAESAECGGGRREGGREGKEEQTAKKVTNRQELNFLLRAGTPGLRVIRSRENVYISDVY